MIKRNLIIGIVWSILIFNIGCSHKEHQLEVNNVEMIEHIVEAYDHLHGFSGNVLVGHKDSIIYQSTSGFSDYDQQFPNAADTKFRLASLSKQFTAAALLLLEQNGKVDFESPGGPVSGLCRAGGISLGLPGTPDLRQ